jgi:hypothetical protein
VDDPSEVAGPPRGRSPEEQLFDELIFKSDLNEVHLLIDFVSGRPDRNLDRLVMPNPDAPATALSSSTVIERISLMRYPPNKDEPVYNAKNSAFLVMAKDHLSALASPARGLTIAYTMMFVDAEGLSSFHSRRMLRAQSRRPRDTENSGATREGPPSPLPLRDARLELAVTTFPALQKHSLQFRKLRGYLVLFSVFWFFLTGLTYWDAALGRSVLQRLDQFWKTHATAMQDHPDLLNPELCTAYRDGDLELPDPIPKSVDAKKLEDAKKLAAACRNFQFLNRARFETREDLTRVFRCSDRQWTAWLHVWCWGWVLAGDVEHADQKRAGAASPTAGSSSAGAPAAAPTEPPREVVDPAVPGTVATGGAAGPSPPDQQPRKTTPRDQVHWQSAEAVLSVFTTYILPMMFGLLGTLIGAFRSIQAKVRDSELAPRDFALTILGLPLGAVAGVAVGLYFSPSSVPTPGSGGVAGALTLTASGLGFLAGYGSATFFRFIDELLERVFPQSIPPRPSAPPPPIAAGSAAGGAAGAGAGGAAGPIAGGHGV